MKKKTNELESFSSCIQNQLCESPACQIIDSGCDHLIGVHI